MSLGSRLANIFSPSHNTLAPADGDSIAFDGGQHAGAAFDTQKTYRESGSAVMEAEEEEGRRPPYLHVSAHCRQLASYNSAWLD